MKPVEFKGQNVIFGNDQPEYLPLPALRMPDGEVITCWELSDEEMMDIIQTKRIYLSQLTFNQSLHPVMLKVNLEDGINLE